MMLTRTAVFLFFFIHMYIYPFTLHDGNTLVELGVGGCTALIRDNSFGITVFFLH